MTTDCPVHGLETRLPLGIQSSSGCVRAIFNVRAISTWTGDEGQWRKYLIPSSFESWSDLLPLGMVWIWMRNRFDTRSSTHALRFGDER